MAVWFYGVVAAWLCEVGSVVSWLRSYMALWLWSNVALWLCGCAQYALWLHGFVACVYGVVAVWLCAVGAVVVCFLA